MRGIGLRLGRRARESILQNELSGEDRVIMRLASGLADSAYMSFPLMPLARRQALSAMRRGCSTAGRSPAGPGPPRLYRSHRPMNPVPRDGPAAVEFQIVEICA